MKKIVTILGARPQFIKASVVSKAIAKADGLTEVLLHTGQHFDEGMSEVFFSELDMPEPAYQLNIHGGSHGAMTGRMLENVERVLIREMPDAVLVYGDTNSTLAGALAAAKLHTPVAHVEAGLRSFNMRMPEEVNRILTDRVSSWLFAPTDEAVGHLTREGIDSAKIINVGDVMYDVALHHGKRADKLGAGALERFGLSARPYVLVTIHRAENTDDTARLETIVEALIRIASEISTIWPLHPRTRSVLERTGLLAKLSASVQLTEPQGYLDMVRLERAATVIATDSGGVQKEAFFYGIPCVTLRDETEWMELVAAGWNKLVPPVTVNDIVEAILSARGMVGEAIKPYGDGDAATRVVRSLFEGLTSLHDCE